ncbi:MAG TPA: RHS repeat-associated core domain-containing protein, partial [Polyangiaceae bacterium]
CSCANALDYDNDGRTEIYTGGGWGYKLSYDSASNAWTRTEDKSGAWAFGCMRQVMDLDGDGRPEIVDLLLRTDRADLAIDTNGDGVLNAVNSFAIDCMPTSHASEYEYLLDDFTRDQGLHESRYLGVRQVCPTKAAADQDSFIRAQLTGNPQFATQDWATDMKVLDANGDGLKDILTWSASKTAASGQGASSYLRLWTNTGRNKFTGGQAVGPTMWLGDSIELDSFLNAGTFKQSIVYDANGDGLEDLVFLTSAHSGYAAALLAKPDPEYGTNFQLITSNTVNGELPSWFRPTSRVVVLDVDGDGASDLLMGEGADQAVAFQKWADHDLLETVTDGNGRTASINYASGKAADIYQDTLPQTELSIPLHILPPTVESITTTKTDGLTLKESYKYKDGRIGYYGRGFLGFTEIAKTVAGSDVGIVSDEHTYYHPDTLDTERLGSSTDVSRIYAEAGRPWKHVVVRHGVQSGFGAATKTVDEVVTHTRSIRQLLSEAKVYMYLPWLETITQSERDGQGNEQVLLTTSIAHNYYTSGLPWIDNRTVTGPSGTLLESLTTTIDYESGQSFLDKNLIALPRVVTRVAWNAGYSVTHQDESDYYDNGLLHHFTSEADDPTLSVATEYRYNDRGNATTVIQTAGAITREVDLIYDAAGDFIESSLNPLLHPTAYSHYRGYGQLALTKDSNGLVDWRQIDSFGREISTTDPNGNTTTTSYEAPGSEATFLSTAGRSVAIAVRRVFAGLSSSVTFYDALGHSIGQTTLDADTGVAPLHTQNHYDSLGRKVSRSHAPFFDGGPAERRDRIEYDNANRPVSITVATDATASKQATYTMSYGHASEIAGSSVYGVQSVVATYPNQSTQTKVLDADGRTLSMVDRNGSAVSYIYDATGEVTQFTDQANLVMYKLHDRRGRTTLTVDPLRGPTHVQYSPLGDTVSSTTPTGNITTHFDALNRIVDETSPEGTTTWTYDSEPGAIGRLVKVTGPATATAPGGNSVHYSYGADTEAAGERGKLREVSEAIAGETFTTNYDHDAFERLTEVHYPAMSNGVRYSVTNEYSTAGRLSAIVEGNGGQGRTLWQVTARDSIGRVKTEQSLGTMSTGYDFSDIDGLITAMTTSEGTTEKHAVSYAYDVEHNVTSLTSHVAAESRYYQYDRSGRFTDEFAGTSSSGTLLDHVDYLPNGNIGAKSDVGTYSYKALGNPYAVTSIGGGAITYEYDSVGRVKQRTAPNLPGGGQTFTWTSFDAVSSITDGTASHLQTTYEYDGLKRRVLETTPTQQKFHVSDLYQRTDELLSGNRMHVMMIRAAGALVAQVEIAESGSGTVGSLNVSLVRSDRLGSTTVLRDNAGNYTTTTYDAFGKASIPTSLSSAIGFGGYYQDDNNALLWMSNRPYDAQIGRTLTPDPVVSGDMGQDGANRYAYVFNRPTSMIDPSGFEGCPVGGGFVPNSWCGIATDPLGQVRPRSGTAASYAWNYIRHSGILDSNIPNVPTAPGTTPESVPMTSGEILAWEPYETTTDATTATIGAEEASGAFIACAQCSADLIAEGVGPQLPPGAKEAMDAGRNKAYVLTLKAWIISAAIEMGVGWLFAPELTVATEAVAATTETI